MEAKKDLCNFNNYKSTKKNVKFCTRLLKTINFDKSHRHKRKIAMLLLLHVKNLQEAIVRHRRRSQQRIRQRRNMLCIFFITQTIELHTKYIEMHSVLSKKLWRKKYLKKRNLFCSSKHSKTFKISKPLYNSICEQFNEEQFLNNFRMTRRCFVWLCDQLRGSLQVGKRDFSKKELFPEIRIAVALYMLAHGELYSEQVAQMFNIPSGSVSNYVKQFASSLLGSIGHALLTLPKNKSDFDDIRYGFHRMTSMPPAVVGVLGVCTMPMIHCSERTIRMEVLIDDRMLLRKLQISSKPIEPLFSEFNNEITELPEQLINERYLPCFVLAPIEQNYPLRPWLLQRYLDPIAPHEYDFNEAADNLQKISEKAVQRLYSRWQYLAKPLKSPLDTTVLFITACCALHNLLEEMDQPYLEEWSDAVNINGFMHGNCLPKPDKCSFAEDALDIRDFLARTISSTEM